VTRTRPRSEVPPVTEKLSTGSLYGGPAPGAHRQLEDPSKDEPRDGTGDEQGPSSTLGP
jgi:hypothetical protein